MADRDYHLKIITIFCDNSGCYTPIRATEEYLKTYDGHYVFCSTVCQMEWEGKKSLKNEH